MPCSGAQADEFPIQFARLEVISNHGHDYYTCVYRFRVHAKQDV